jgi:hypothetical protein
MKKVKECICLPRPTSMQLWEFTRLPRSFRNHRGHQNAAKLRDKWLLWVEKIYGKRVQSNVVFLKRQYGEIKADYSKEKICPQL